MRTRNLASVCVVVGALGGTVRAQGVLETETANVLGVGAVEGGGGVEDLHANVGYQILGDPPGVTASDIFLWAVGAQVALSPKIELFGEVLGETNSVPEGMEGEPMGAAAELEGGETIGTLGALYYLGSTALVSLGVSVDNNAAVLIHPGVVVRHQF